MKYQSLEEMIHAGVVVAKSINDVILSQTKKRGHREGHPPVKPTEAFLKQVRSPAWEKK